MLLRILPFALICLVSFTACADERPNIIIIMADDLGYGDVGYHPQSEPDVVTPNIDRLAQEGAMFTAGYAMHPVCGPSRAGLLTGRYQQRFGYHDNIGPRVREIGMERGLPLDQKTFGNIFQDLGYVTGWVGKWHDGDEEKFWPHNRGFDETYGFNNGAANYFIGPENTSDKTPVWGAIHRNGERIDNFNDYLTDAFGNEAVAFVKRHRDHPFCLYLAFNAVHGPMQARPEDIQRFSHIPDKDRRICLAMNYNMDQNIGRLLNTLSELQLQEKTLIFFYSDNGGAGMPRNSSNKPLRGYKGETLEGGIRVPFIAHWPGTIPAGQTRHEPVLAIDILPTMVNAAKARIQRSWQLDGINLLPYLTGQQDQLAQRYLFWDNTINWAVRDHEWKLVSTNLKKIPGRQAKGRLTGLFRIATDDSESEDLQRQHPEVVQRLEKALAQWRTQNEAPRFGWGAHIGPNVGYRGKHLPN